MERLIVKAYAELSPERVATGVKLLRDDGDTLIARGYSQPKGRHVLRPTPYQSFRFNKKSHVLSKLSSRGTGGIQNQELQVKVLGVCDCSFAF